MGPKDSGPFDPLLPSSSFRFAGNDLAFQCFCPRSLCCLVSPSLNDPDPHGSYSGPLSFPFSALNIHTECELTFLFLHHIFRFLCLSICPDLINLIGLFFNSVITYFGSPITVDMLFSNLVAVSSCNSNLIA